jgi:hypothetical protein
MSITPEQFLDNDYSVLTREDFKLHTIETSICPYYSL